jgi:MFS family permease
MEMPLTEKMSSDEQFGLLRTILVITILSGVNFIGCMGTGILTIALPRIAPDVGLNSSLMVWPAFVYALSAGCTLLLFGLIADWWATSTFGCLEACHIPS